MCYGICMIQDIAPHILDNVYSPRPPRDEDFVLVCRDGQVLLNVETKEIKLPQYRHFKGESLLFLFTLDGMGFYLHTGEVEELEGFTYVNIRLPLNEFKPKHLVFAVLTGLHLATWYDSNRFCGKCASQMEHSTTERALLCPKCGLTKYPQISPVVIVGITNGDNLLLTKYASGYDRYALVAGFAEIGETLEETVKREILEEVGLKVRNIRYYKSQPWAFSQSLLMGFFADICDDTTVEVDKNELSEATWFHRSQIPKDDTGAMSLTWNMIEAFRANIHPI
ncbi:MAG: NAD(+) diphosphatase [Defluviitaleaceae bacterium]|nr:NAD(+) diphosphatase [Defluviitaleaceae bacterium]